MGCNPWFGLEPTRSAPPIDAQYFDRPTDAPARCPSAGAAPRFDELFHQLEATGCRSYTTDQQGFAMALCGGKIARGPFEGPLVPIPYAVPTGHVAAEVRLAPEGNLAFVFEEGVPMPTKNQFGVIVPDETGTGWTEIAAIPTMESSTNATQISTPSRGPERHAIVVDLDPAFQYMMNEWVGDGATWQPVDRYPLKPVLGAQFSPGPLSLSADGLRLVFNGRDAGGAEATFYVERASTAVRFGTATAITTVPSGLVSPYLTDDCERLYFTAVDRVFYVMQE